MAFHPVVRTRLYRALKKDVMAAGHLWPSRWPEIAKNLKDVYENVEGAPHSYKKQTKLSSAFVWVESEQGHVYWQLIATGVQSWMVYND